MDRQTIDKVIEILDDRNGKDTLCIIQFKGCNAYASTEEYLTVDGHPHRVRAIISYDTIVGFVDIDHKTLYEYGKYTSTTSCQITKMHCTWFPGYERVLVKGVDTSKRFTKKSYGSR